MKFDSCYIDIAFVNSRVITVNKNNEIAEAVGIKSNKIVFVGNQRELLKLIDSKTKVIDLKGKTLMPGMVDSHFHAILNGFVGNDIDSTIINIGRARCTSIAEVLKVLSRAVQIKSPGEWVSSMGYEPMFLKEKRHPFIEELDYIAPNNPIVCMHVSGHICMYNSEALKRLGVLNAEDAKKFPKDEIEVVNGVLTGIVKEQTHFMLWEKANYSLQEQESAALKSQRQLLENGITSIHDCGECGTSSYHLMQKLCQTGGFKSRVYMMLHNIFGKKLSREENNSFLSLGFMTGLGDDHYRIGSCKFIIDGGSGAPSCATREPYSHNPDLPGIIGFTREEVSNYVQEIVQSECQVTAHALGDLAVEFMVEAYEKAYEKRLDLELRHRIEHCTITDLDLIQRMSLLNVHPVLNPGMLTFQGKHYTDIFGEERCKYLIALKTMIDLGLKPCIGSDAPSGPMGLALIDGAVNRYDRNEMFQFDESQKISVLDAIRCATYNGAYASFEEDIKGSLEVGKLADLIVLSGDILSIPPQNINQLYVDMTMIDGKIEYIK